MWRRGGRWPLVALVAAVAAVAGSVGSASGGKSPNASKIPSEVTIAYQPGIGYAPLIIIRRQRLLEKRYPGTKFNWRVLASGTPITEGVISGDIQIGAMGVSPFLVGWARGVGWKLLSALDDADLWLMARDPSIRTIGDLRGKRVATPTNTSIQATVLRRAAQARLGDARALDTTLVALDHPDGLAALFGGQIQAHFTSPPFQFIEQQRGARILLRSSSLFGEHTFLGVAMTEKFYDQNTAFAKGFYKDIQAAMKMLQKKPGQAAAILSADSGGRTTAYGFRRYIKSPAIDFTVRPKGFMRFARFMNEIGAIRKMPANWKELTFPTLHNTKGS